MSTILRYCRVLYFARIIPRSFYLKHCSLCHYSCYHSQANSSQQQQQEQQQNKERNDYERLKEEGEGYSKYERNNRSTWSSSLFLWLRSVVPIALIVPLYYAYRYKRIYDDFISSEASTKTQIIQQYLEELHATQTEAELVDFRY
jgi:hypothetical protein